jgi:chorismate mutase
VGLITGLLGLPVAPLRGAVWAAEQVRQQAEEEFYDPARIKAQLEDVDRARSAGELSDDEATAIEDELVERLLVSRSRPAPWEG